MELLSNLVWVIVALAFWGAWLGESRRPRAAARRSGIGAQLIALAVLSVMLLPVISVSDDLQASHNPAEVERTCIRSDQHLLLPDAPPPAPAALAVVIASLLFEIQHPTAFACPRIAPVREQIGSVRPLASRPPPIA